MQRRAYERKPSNVKTKFFLGNSVYFGTITNFSENGLFVDTKDIYFPLRSRFEIFIPSSGEVLKLPVEVRRLAETGDIHYGMGVELLDPPQNYLEFMDSLRTEK